MQYVYTLYSEIPLMQLEDYITDVADYSMLVDVYIFFCNIFFVIMYTLNTMSAKMFN